MTDPATEDVSIESALIEQITTAKREIGALHLLLATIIGDGNTAFVKKTAIAAGGKALKMSDDKDNFILKVVDIPIGEAESVV